MERRVALLRAINVGGTGTLRMQRLRRLAAELGWKDITTLGASGNLLYTARRTQPGTDASNLAKAVEQELGKPATVIIRTRTEIDKILAAQPFRNTASSIPTKWWFVGLLVGPARAPLPEIPPGTPLAFAERLPREICWTMAAPDRRAIDLPKRIEKTLGVAMTVRNWNVIHQIAQRLAAT